MTAATGHGRARSVGRGNAQPLLDLRRGVAEAQPTAQDHLAAIPGILVTTAEPEVNAAAVKALANDGTVFQRADALVRITQLPFDSEEEKVTRAAGTPTINVIPTAMVRDRLTANAKFVKWVQRSEGWILIPAHPPNWCVSAVASYGTWPVPVLQGVVDCPIIRRDGSILALPGYDRMTGLYLEPGGPTVRVPEQPIKDEVDAAVEALLDPVCDFPFATEAHRAAHVAAILIPLCRFAFSYRFER
jgi:hypothetical protein